MLSLQLSFAVFPLVMFTSDRVKMGEFANSAWVKALAYLVAYQLGVDEEHRRVEAIEDGG